MSESGKQSPLGAGALGALLQDTGLCMNPPTVALVGTSKVPSSYTYGTICQNTCLRLLTYSIRDAWVRQKVNSGTYTNLYNISSYDVPALGNARPSTFTRPEWPKWNPYTVANTYANELTSWGYVRLAALQGWNEWNFNGTQPEYRDFLQSFMTANSFVEYSNEAILSMHYSKSFLEGSFSNMNDLMTGDITSVNLSTANFGQDLITLGKAIDLQTIDLFGYPSNLLDILQQNNAITKHLSTKLVESTITPDRLREIIAKTSPPTVLEERQLLVVFTATTGSDLTDILIPLNCKTTGLSNLSDLLNIKKLFPTSFSSMTVPIFSTSFGSSNSKRAELIFTGSGGASQQILNIYGNDPRHSLLTDVAAGPSAAAFSEAMQHVRNIKSSSIEKFAQVVRNLETTAGLNQIGGTTETSHPAANGDPFWPLNGGSKPYATKQRVPSLNGSTVPANLPTVHNGLGLIALGSGPHGTYTMSDLFGCVSGLPYDWAAIKNYITQLETSRLYNIYRALYLAVTWQPALGSVSLIYRQRQTRVWVQGYLEQAYVAPVSFDPKQYSDPPTNTIEIYQTPAVPFIAERPEVTAVYEHDWHIDTITLTDPGGGYGRGKTAPIPTVTQPASALKPTVEITGGSLATAVTTISTNDALVPGDFGRVTSLTLTFTGNWVHYATVETPTVTYLPGASYPTTGPAPSAPPRPPVPSPPLVRIQCPPVGD